MPAHRIPDVLGRGRLTRWLPVYGQADSVPPPVEPFPTRGSMTPGRFLRRVLLSAKRLTIPAALLSVLHQVGEALVPVIAGAAIDRALATGDARQLVLWLVVLGVNFLALSLAFRFSAQLTERASELAQHRLRATLSGAVLHPDGGSGSSPEGSVVSVMTNDVSRIGALGLVVFPVGELAGVVFIAISLLVIHWPLGLAVLIGAPVVVWLMGVASSQYARTNRDYQSLLAKTVGRASDLVAGYRVIKGVRAEGEATRRYRQASQQTRQGAYRLVGALGRFLVGSNILSGVFIAAVAGLAGWFAINGELSVGGLIAAVGLTQALLPPMRMLTGNAVPLWAAAVASSDRVLETLTDDAAEDASEAPQTPDAQWKTADLPASDAASDAVPVVEVPAVEVPVVELTVPGHGTARIEPGEIVGVLADDATATRLAHAFLHPRRPARIQERGIRVSIDGTLTETMPNSAYRSLVLSAPHHPALFSGTIHENLAVAGGADNLAVTDGQPYAEAVEAAACEDFITAAGGTDAAVGEMGNRLSGGQRQRLGLARVLAVDAPVLVLHDPTTAVDSVTEAHIASGLSGLRRGRSTVLITSSPALLGVCDRIIDLRQNDGTAES